MGSSDEEIAAVLAEAQAAGSHSEYIAYSQALSGPQHFVRLSKPYYLGTCEVTMGQFERFVAETGYRTLAERATDTTENWRSAAQDGRSNLPALYIAWDDAQEFSRWLSRREGRQYQLPSEAQWEFACRAGKKTRWSCGDDPRLLAAHARYGQPADSGPDPVGQKGANSFGLHDMHGNADEWCLDWHAKDFYRSGTAVDPVCGDIDRQDASCRVVRGGWWGTTPAGLVRSAARYYAFPNSAPRNLGFRLALVGDLDRRTSEMKADAASSAPWATVEIPVNLPWVPTGLHLEPDMEVAIRASGFVHAAPEADLRDYFRLVPPAGRASRFDQFPAKHLPGLALLGRVGDGPPFLVGAEFQLRIRQSDGGGELFLGINDDYVGDNRGNWTARISQRSRKSVDSEERDR
jgi:formylglycine-generating enzyme required for sulfatase activity